jgi:hypothetical protein
MRIPESTSDILVESAVLPGGNAHPSGGGNLCGATRFFAAGRCRLMGSHVDPLD